MLCTRWLASSPKLTMKVCISWTRKKKISSFARFLLPFFFSFLISRSPDSRWWMAASGNAKAISESGDIDFSANLGRLPLLKVEGKGSIGQSLAIWFYVASELGFLGSNTFEAAQIISVAETIKETNDAFRKLLPCSLLLFSLPFFLPPPPSFFLNPSLSLLLLSRRRRSQARNRRQVVLRGGLRLDRQS